MTSIEEIPLAEQDIAPAAAQDIEDIQPEYPENTAAQPEKRGRGRPPGAKNKPKEAVPKARPAEAVPKARPTEAVPKAKPAKTKKKEVPRVEYEDDDESSEEEAPRPRRRVAPAPEQLDRRALAAEMLELLQQQRYSRAAARRDHYASWFQNM